MLQSPRTLIPSIVFWMFDNSNVRREYELCFGVLVFCVFFPHRDIDSTRIILARFSPEPRATPLQRLPERAPFCASTCALAVIAAWKAPRQRRWCGRSWPEERSCRGPVVVPTKPRVNFYRILTDPNLMGGGGEIDSPQDWKTIRGVVFICAPW